MADGNKKDRPRDLFTALAQKGGQIIRSDIKPIIYWAI